MLLKLCHRAVALALVFGAAAHPYASAQVDQVARIVQRDQLNLGFREDAPPFSGLDASKAAVGYSIDICNGIAQHLRTALQRPNLKVRPVPVAADQVDRTVASGGVDLMCAGQSDTPERRAQMRFSPVIFVAHQKFMVRATDAAKSARDLAGKTVSVIGRSTAEKGVEQYAKSAGITLKLARALDAEAAFAQLQLGQSAAWARDDVLLMSAAAKAKPADWRLLPESLGTERIAIALPNDARLQGLVEQALAQLQRSGALAAAYERWFVKGNALIEKGLSLPISDELSKAWERLR